MEFVSVEVLNQLLKDFPETELSMSFSLELYAVSSN
jgi:hypothetical protein